MIHKYSLKQKINELKFIIPFPTVGATIGRPLQNGEISTAETSNPYGLGGGFAHHFPRFHRRGDHWSPAPNGEFSTAQPITPYNGRGDLRSPVTKQWDFSLTIRQPTLSPFAKKFFAELFFKKATKRILASSHPPPPRRHKKTGWENPTCQNSKF